jgi:hypothetical protein
MQGYSKPGGSSKGSSAPGQFGKMSGAGTSENTMSEYGLTSGKSIKGNSKLDYTQQPESHKLAHSDYGEITGE